MEERQQRLKEIEEAMGQPDFWLNKEAAQAAVKEFNDLKAQLEGEADGAAGGLGANAGPYDRGGAVLTIFSGAGGDDAEDFSHILFEMYRAYIRSRGWSVSLLHQNENDHGGFRNVSFEVDGRNVYGTLKHESGVHRLVRISPFNAKKLRHTSFSMVEVIPKFEKNVDIVIPPDDLKIEFARSSGPGGQNVNKRETAVRIVHVPTKLAVHVETERSQAQNKDKALELLKGKIYHREEEERKAKEKGMYISKTTSVEWGNQIRSYVTHPYKLVKDHRTNVEVRDVDRVFGGDLDAFIEAEKDL